MIQTVEKTYMKEIVGEGLVWSGHYCITYNDNTQIHVPHDTSNRHYQEILEWVANGGTIIDNGS